MQYRTFDKTGQEVSLLGMGTMRPVSYTHLAASHTLNPRFTKNSFTIKRSFSSSSAINRLYTIHLPPVSLFYKSLCPFYVFLPAGMIFLSAYSQYSILSPKQNSAWSSFPLSICNFINWYFLHQYIHFFTKMYILIIPLML